MSPALSAGLTVPLDLDRKFPAKLDAGCHDRIIRIPYLTLKIDDGETAFLQPPVDYPR